MNAKSRNCTIDLLRLFMAILIVALHSSPFVEFNTMASYLISQMIAKLGVPYFAAVAGYFFFKNETKELYKKSIIKNIRLYTIWSAIMFTYVGIYRMLHGSSFVAVIKQCTIWYFLKGFYHLWYMLALIYTLILLFVFHYINKNICSFVYKISFGLLLIGILIFGYGNWFLNLPLVNNTIGRLDLNQPMQTQWLFGIIPFFMMGYGLNKIKDRMQWNHVEVLFGISLAGFFIEAILVNILNLSTSLTLCIFTYPVIYFLILVTLKHPMSEHTKAANLCSGTASFLYFSHIFMVLVLQNARVSETAVFFLSVIIMGSLGLLLVRINNPLLNKLYK